MPHNSDCLGLCFFGDQLFYGVHAAGNGNRVKHIGAVDFNFDVADSLYSNKESNIKGLRSSIRDLKERFDARHLHILLHPDRECWATLPKLVYDNADERQSYINILMNGMARSHIHPSWHSLSNENYKLLQLRSDHMLEGVQELTTGMSDVGFSSAFEIGELWINHAQPGGSFLTVGAFNGCISVGSFILGKLRGATYIEFDDPEDLPYLWLQKAEHLSWMQGLHEQIQVYGLRSHRIIEILKPFWDDAGTITKMDTLEKMQISAEEETYGFDLALAYPAIMLALR